MINIYAWDKEILESHIKYSKFDIVDSNLKSCLLNILIDSFDIDINQINFKPYLAKCINKFSVNDCDVKITSELIYLVNQFITNNALFKLVEHNPKNEQYIFNCELLTHCYLSIKFNDNQCVVSIMYQCSDGCFDVLLTIAAVCSNANHDKVSIIKKNWETELIRFNNVIKSWSITHDVDPDAIPEIMIAIIQQTEGRISPELPSIRHLLHAEIYNFRDLPTNDSLTALRTMSKYFSYSYIHYDDEYFTLGKTIVHGMLFSLLQHKQEDDMKQLAKLLTFDVAYKIEATNDDLYGSIESLLENVFSEYETLILDKKILHSNLHILLKAIRLQLENSDPYKFDWLIDNDIRQHDHEKCQ